MLDGLAALIHRRRRRFLWGSLVVVLVAGFLGGPVFGLLDTGDDFDDPQAEAVLASADVARATGASASPDLVRQVGEATDAGPAELWAFFSNGMLLNVIAALNLEVLAPSEEWAACWVDPETMLADAEAARLG